MNEHEVRERLRAFVRKCAKLPASASLQDDTPLLEGGLLTSLDVAQLFLLIESMLDTEIDLSQVGPEVLVDLNAIWSAFFAPVMEARVESNAAATPPGA